ncbi:MAG: hypothetical protein ACR2LA_08765 [Acidimicrobiales bacterium]
MDDVKAPLGQLVDLLIEATEVVAELVTADLEAHAVLAGVAHPTADGGDALTCRGVARVSASDLAGRRRRLSWWWRLAVVHDQLLRRGGGGTAEAVDGARREPAMTDHAPAL